MDYIWIDFTIVSLILVVLALVLIYRVVKGPHIVDIIIAADCIDIILGIVMVVYGCLQGRSLYVDLGLIVALLGFIGTVLISKYLEGKL